MDPFLFLKMFIYLEPLLTRWTNMVDRASLYSLLRSTNFTPVSAAGDSAVLFGLMSFGFFLFFVPPIFGWIQCFATLSFLLTWHLLLMFFNYSLTLFLLNHLLTFVDCSYSPKLGYFSDLSYFCYSLIQSGYCHSFGTTVHQYPSFCCLKFSTFPAALLFCLVSMSELTILWHERVLVFALQSTFLKHYRKLWFLHFHFINDSINASISLVPLVLH